MCGKQQHRTNETFQWNDYCAKLVHDDSPKSYSKQKKDDDNFQKKKKKKVWL